MFNKVSSSELSLASAACMAVVALGALALWPAGSSEVHARPGEDASHARPGEDASGLLPPPGFGRRIAGTWVEAGDGFSATINIRADGTMTWWGSWFFGDGTGQFFNGPVFVTWKRTGMREITTTELGYLNNGDGSFFASGRLQEVFSFDRELESFDYAGVEELFAPGQDPTDPDAVPFDSFGFAGGPIKRLGFIPAIGDDDDDDDNDDNDYAESPAPGTNGLGTARDHRSRLTPTRRAHH